MGSSRTPPALASGHGWPQPTRGDEEPEFGAEGAHQDGKLTPFQALWLGSMPEQAPRYLPSMRATIDRAGHEGQENPRPRTQEAAAADPL